MPGITNIHQDQVGHLRFGNGNSLFAVIRNNRLVAALFERLRDHMLFGGRIVNN